MKKILIVVSCFFAFNSFAQKRSNQFSIAAEGAVMATEQAFLVYQAGFGGSAKFLMATGKKNYFTASLGVLNFSAKPITGKEMLSLVGGSSLGLPADINAALSEVNVANAPLRIITPKVGYKYFLNKNLNVEVEAGYCFASVRKLVNSYPGEIGGYDFSFGMGVKVAKKIDIGLRYEQFQSTASQRDFTSFIALRTLVDIDFK
jgi:hypothetical protein